MKSTWNLSKKLIALIVVLFISFFSISVTLSPGRDTDVNALWRFWKSVYFKSTVYLNTIVGDSSSTISIDSSDWDISTTGAVTGIASVGYDSSTTVYHDTVELTNAEIKALRATPKTLVAAPGSGYVLELVSAVLILDYGTNVLSESADNLVIEYATSGADATAAIETTGFIDQAADQMALIPAASIATDAAADLSNKALQLFNTGDGEIAGNAAEDSTMTVKVAYLVHATGL